ncbi:MAG: flagellar export chaperone FlgN [Aminivibrio sp.]|nr:flagellar protein FlgN [Synergistaceae bacterium]
MQDDFSENLSSLVSTELALYNELAFLVQKEGELVKSGDMEGLLAILAEKQDVISRQELVQEGWNNICSGLGISEGRDGPVFWEKVASLLGTDGADVLKESLAVIRDTAGAVLEDELKVQALLEDHVEELRKEMLRINKGKKAVRGYTRSGGSFR